MNATRMLSWDVLNGVSKFSFILIWPFFLRLNLTEYLIHLALCEVITFNVSVIYKTARNYQLYVRPSQGHSSLTSHNDNTKLLCLFSCCLYFSFACCVLYFYS